LRQTTLIVLKSDIWLDFNKLLFTTIFFKCHAHSLFLYSTRNRDGIPILCKVGGIFLSSTWRESYVSNVSHTAVYIDCHIELYRYVTCIWLWHALSFYLKMLRAKKFELKRKFIGNKYRSYEQLNRCFSKRTASI